MRDPRETQLAKLLVSYSCSVQKGEKVFIEAIDIPCSFTQQLVECVHQAGGVPFVKIVSGEVERTLLLNGSAESWEYQASAEELLMSQADCYIGVRGSHNIYEKSDVPADKRKLYEERMWKRVHQNHRVPHTKWVVLRWPTPAMAQLAELSTQAFEDFYFSVCCFDYQKLEKAVAPLVQLMEQTDDVRIVGPGDTDLRFSIKGIPVVPCCGRRNIPDGEVFTAPVKDSVEGVIAYNTPSPYRGETHDHVRFECKKGKIVAATSSNQAALDAVLDTDEGARYFGEFAIGLNPYCWKPMRDILFDEKIRGSIHLTPGNCYDEASNGNKSLVHWDLVLRQTADLGGGEIYFDDQLIRKDGLFVHPDLLGLNPDQLKV